MAHHFLLNTQSVLSRAVQAVEQGLRARLADLAAHAPGVTKGLLGGGPRGLGIAALRERLGLPEQQSPQNRWTGRRRRARAARAQPDSHLQTINGRAQLAALQMERAQLEIERAQKLRVARGKTLAQPLTQLVLGAPELPVFTKQARQGQPEPGLAARHPLGERERLA